MNTPHHSPEIPQEDDPASPEQFLMVPPMALPSHVDRTQSWTREQVTQRIWDLGGACPYTPRWDEKNMVGRAVEMVPLKDVVGSAGYPMPDWQVSDSPGRGLDNIQRLIHDLLKTGVLEPGGPCLQVCEYRGKYFVEEGRHRVAALKCLNVQEAPMIVTHYQDVAVPPTAYTGT